MIAPDPVEAFLGHAEGNDDVDMVAVVVLIRIPECRRDPLSPGRVIIDQVGDPKHAAPGRLDQLESGSWIGALPLAQLLDNVFDLPDFVFGALAGIDVGDVDDRLPVWIEHPQDVVGVISCVEEITDVEPFQMLVAVELLVVGVGDGLELGFVVRHEHGLRIAAEIRSRHCQDMRAVARDELPEMLAEPVFGIGRDVVELVDGNQPAVESVRAEPVHGETKGGMRTDENSVLAMEKRLDRIDLSAISAWCVAEVPFWADGPVRPEAELAKRCVVKARTDGPFGHDDDRLAETLVVHLVQSDEHQRPALARGRRGLDQEVLLAALLPGPLLHWAHAEFVGFRGTAVAGV